MSSQETQKLHALTSLRFLAASLILVHHLRGHFGISSNVWKPLALDNGVSFFFVLSGFILTYVYASKPTLPKRRFLLARFARIWPAHICALLLLICAFPGVLSYNFSFLKLLANITMVHSWIPIRAYNDSFVGPSWSISTEFGFYLCFLLLITRWRQTWHLKLFISVCIVTIVIFATNAFLPSIPPSARADFQRSMVYINPLGRLFEFTLGMATAEIWRRSFSRMQVSLLSGTLLELGAVAFVGFALAKATSYAGYTYQWIGSAGAEWFAHGGVSCVPVAALIFVFALQRGLLSRCLAISQFVFLGEISYSFYLIHQTFIEWVRRNSQAFAVLPNWFLVTLLIAAILMTSYFMWAYVERPMRAILLGFGRSEPKATSDSSAEPQLPPIQFKLSRQIPPLSFPSVAAGAILLILLGVAIWLVRFRSSIQIIAASDVEKITAVTPLELQSVGFGNRFVLCGYKWHTDKPDEIVLELAWKAPSPQRLEFLTAVHLIDDQGNIRGQADYEEDPTHREVSKDLTWRHLISISPEKLQGISRIGIGLLKGKDWLFADRGPRDWGARRLLIPGPQGKPKSAMQSSPDRFAGFLEVANTNKIIGWVWNTQQPEKKLDVDVFDGEVNLMTLAATNFRPDLLKGKVGDGFYSFGIATPTQLKDGKPHEIHVRVSGEKFELKNSPKTILP